MFWSETLLARNGPLARVWLASNLEKKLSKQNILTEKIDIKVRDIINSQDAPKSLRLSAQLLLGVARIYSRKAKYLMDDCAEALLKIKMAFRPGNVDLPSNESHKANAAALILPDTITDLDLFAPLPDPDELLREPESRGPGRDPTLLDFGASQLLPDSQTPTRRKEKSMLLDDDDLGLDLGLEPGEELVRSTPAETERSIEIGRRAATPRRDDPSMLMDDDDLGLDLGLDIGDSTLHAPPLDLDDDVPMLGMDDDNRPSNDADIAAANAAALARVDAATDRRQRDSASPLSTIASDVERDLEKTFQLDRSLAAEQEEEPEEEMVRAAHRVKRRRIIPADAETELHNSQIKRQQEDRSAITRPPSFLPRDPLLLQLMEMQRNGEFVSHIMGDGRMRGWAPELRGILSIEVIRKSGERKRKRDSGVADVDVEVETGSEGQATPRLELPQQEEDEGFHAMDGGTGDYGGVDTTLLHSDGAAPPQLMSDGLQPAPSDADAAAPAATDDDATNAPAFETTEAPLLHPSHSGPISLATKSAVSLLRSHLAPDHPPDAGVPPTPSKRVKAEALFTDLCPVATTRKDDATKLFFELLVLGTRDAVKVEQEVGGGIGMPIRVRGKRGLWEGNWAAAEREGVQVEGEGVEAA
ncbi:hypothetical protein BAUCODRAFT_123186 [Baudoinia panamericana UAMH 10762]|uniref:Rad21/Rec8-like protein N-terminal domain-containing protein n=1 Tax=Baudoinia panamericana (strain UAMH 10762) TaxID=717646 RepID=M2LNG7_BAUPA|nr:uncharacterized protein BAUCODRAFT_123186 [Baudoinia panamericana UAMH 10762]EMC95897.1 hypothetical protein BAUCODRAFT_123186 [Baudoinia panamericana UAMH 10762]